jgi:hypothetical protein
MGLGGLAAAAAAATLLGACGNTTPAASAPPQQAVSSAFDALGSQSSVAMHISLGVTGSQLQKLAGKDDSGGLTLTAANDLAATSIVVDLNTGNNQPLNKQTSTDSSAQFGLGVHVGTATPNSAKPDIANPVELRYVNQTFYVLADLPTLLTDLNQSPAAAAGFQSAVESTEANNVVPGLAALGQGEWVSVSASDLNTLLQGLQTMMPGAAGTSGSSISAQQLWSELRTAFTANAHFSKVGSPHNGRTHYTAALAVKPFIQDVERLLPASLGSVPGATSIGKQVNDAVGKIGNRKLVTDVYVSDNKVQEIDIDLNQFDNQYGSAVPLRIQIGTGTTVQPPPNPTQLNLSKVGQLLGGMLSGGSSN